MISAMVTGHKPARLRGQELMVLTELNKLIKRFQPDIAISGMADGADRIWAMAALNNGIPLGCYFPYKKDFYHSPQELHIMEQASEIIYVNENYSEDCYYLRDMAMVDDSDIVIAVFDGFPHGGTYQTIRYAQKRGKTIWYIMIE